MDVLRGSLFSSGEPAGLGTWSPLLQGDLLAGSIPTGLCAPLGSQWGCQPRLGLQPPSLLLCCPAVPTANPNCKGE